MIDVETFSYHLLFQSRQKENRALEIPRSTLTRAIEKSRARIVGSALLVGTVWGMYSLYKCLVLLREKERRTSVSVFLRHSTGFKFIHSVLLLVLFSHI